MKVQKVHGNEKLKKADIKINGKIYSRHLIKTEPFKKGDDYVNKISEYVDRVMKKTNERWFVVVSEKLWQLRKVEVILSGILNHLLGKNSFKIR